MKSATNPSVKLPVSVKREVPSQALQPFTDYFQGFEKIEAVRKVFGEETEAVLAGLKIGFIANRRMYMGIRDDDGHIAVGTYHLRHSPDLIIYLDIVHELFHIKQWMRDKEWFTAEHEKFMGNGSLYYVSPLEVPAYEHTVREAERLGMVPQEIVEYLEMMPVTPKIWNGFLKAMGLGSRAEAAAVARHDPPTSSSSSTSARRGPEHLLPAVTINRDPRLVLLPFTDYFQGFEEVPAVKALFGERTKAVLQDIKVEFLESPFGSIFVSDDEEKERHLVVNSSFVKEADIEAIYLDVIFCLNLHHRMMMTRAADATEVSPSSFRQFDNPVMLESYKAMVEEARRIGVPDESIVGHLQLPRFMMTDAAFRRFIKAIGLKEKMKKKAKRRRGRRSSA